MEGLLFQYSLAFFYVKSIIWVYCTITLCLLDPGRTKDLDKSAQPNIVRYLSTVTGSSPPCTPAAESRCVIARDSSLGESVVLSIGIGRQDRQRQDPGYAFHITDGPPTRRATSRFLPSRRRSPYSHRTALWGAGGATMAHVGCCKRRQVAFMMSAPVLPAFAKGSLANVSC